MINKPELTDMIERLVEAKVAIAAGEKTIKDFETKIFEAVEPFCLAGIEEFNALGGYQISYRPGAATINEQGQLGLSVRIYTRPGPNSRELDEDFSSASEPETAIVSKLRPLIEQKLASEGIPLKFAGIKFPAFYFAK